MAVVMRRMPPPGHPVKVPGLVQVAGMPAESISSRSTIASAGSFSGSARESRSSSLRSDDLTFVRQAAFNAAKPGISRHEVGMVSQVGLKLDNPRWQNQDTPLTIPLGEGRTLVAVFDGHGTWGTFASTRAREVFQRCAPSLLPSAPQPLHQSQAGQALQQLFAMAHQEICKELDARRIPMAMFSGTTATAAIVDSMSRQVAVAHVGDSSLLLAAGGKEVFRTKDHVVDSEAEHRIAAHGGEVQRFEVSGITSRRVCMPGQRFPGLSMSKSLGDLKAQELGVSWQPEVALGIPLTEDACLIVASDGLWEKVPMAEAASAALNAELSCQELAQYFVAVSRSRWSMPGNIDDITAVVLRVQTTKP